MGLRNHTLVQKDSNCFFITTTFNDWLHLLIDVRYYNILDESIVFNCKKYNADILAYIWMPSHIHFILYFENEIKLPEFMRDFKKFTSAQIRRLLEKDNNDILNKLSHENRTQKYKIWKERYDVTYIKHKDVLYTKIEYIHNNSVRKNIVDNAEDYKYSSALFYKKEIHGNVKIRHAGEIVY